MAIVFPIFFSQKLNAVPLIPLFTLKVSWERKVDKLCAAQILRLLASDSCGKFYWFMATGITGVSQR